MAKPTLKLNTPVSDLNWVFITGDGKEDLNGNPKYSASVYFDAEDDVKAFEEQVMEFWKEHKPKSARKPKAIGIYRECEVVGEDGKLTAKSITQPIDVDEFKPTGRIIITAKTGTTWPDGKPVVVKTYNAKGAEVALGDRVIGPGSRGRLGVTLGIYENGANVGVSIYLNSIQITKFVELQSDAGFDAVDEDGWTGDDLNEDGIGAVAAEAPAHNPDSEDKPKAKVKL